MKKLFYTSAADFLLQERDRLLSLLGQSLVATWIVWDQERDEWFADEPVVLQFSQDRIAIVFARLDELSVTWNTIDLQATPNWWGCYEYLDLQWRESGNEILAANVGATLSGISVVEMFSLTTVVEDPLHPERVGAVSTSWLLHALEFHFGQAVTAIFNALDENGVQAVSHAGSDYRHTLVN